VIGNPTTADVVFLIWFFAYFGNLRVIFYRRKKPVFIDFAPMLGQLYMRFWG